MTIGMRLCSGSVAATVPMSLYQLIVEMLLIFINSPVIAGKPHARGGTGGQTRRGDDRLDAAAQARPALRVLRLFPSFDDCVSLCR